MVRERPIATATQKPYREVLPEEACASAKVKLAARRNKRSVQRVEASHDAEMAMESSAIAGEQIKSRQ